MIQRSTGIFHAAVLCLGTTVLCSGVAAQTGATLTVDKAAAASVVIDPTRTLRPQVPATLFSFNMPHIGFERDLWSKKTQTVKPTAASALAPFVGSFFRYPGGLLSNHFDANNAMLTHSERMRRISAGGRAADYPSFGVGEYTELLRSLAAQPWFALNIQGGGTISSPQEWPSSRVAGMNKALAQFLKTRTPWTSTRYYQLGNELDRSHYQWEHSKYVNRARDTINAVRSVDPQAKFVAFMREFNWRYKSPRSGTSRADEFFRDVLRALPMINDFSLHFYYDGALKPGARFVTVPHVVEKIGKALHYAKAARPGENFNVWITEHAKRVYLNGGPQGVTNALDTGLAIGDFLIAMMQLPEVKGAAVQGLEGKPRDMFFGDLKPTPALATLSVLRAQPYPRARASKTYSPNASGYPGGYDTRAVGFTDATGRKLAVSVINRATSAKNFEIQFAPFKSKAVRMKHYYVAGPAGVAPVKVEQNYKLMLKPAAVSKRFSSRGTLTVALPPASISTIVFE